MAESLAVLTPMVASRALADEEVVVRVLAGERPLFELIMRRHNQRLYRLARAVLKNDSEAEDALQEAYLAAFTHLHQFNGESMFSTWLTRIVLNECFRRRRELRLSEVQMPD